MKKDSQSLEIANTDTETTIREDRRQVYLYKQAGTATILVVGIVISLILAWLFGIFSTKEKQQSALAIKTSFRYGVATLNEHEILSESAALAIATSQKDSYTLVVAKKGGRSVPMIVRHRYNEMEPISVSIIDEDVTTVLNDRTETLCNNIPKSACSVKENNDGVLTVANKRFTWDKSQQKWVSGTTTFDTDVIFGRVDDLVIGSQEADSYTGQIRTYDVPVDSITAFDIHTGKAVWTKKLNLPGFVSVNQDHIVVADAPLSHDEVTTQLTPHFRVNAENSLQAANNLIAGSTQAQLYELVPAEKGKSEAVEPQ